MSRLMFVYHHLLFAKEHMGVLNHHPKPERADRTPTKYSAVANVRSRVRLDLLRCIAMVMYTKQTLQNDAASSLQ